MDSKLKRESSSVNGSSSRGVGEMSSDTESFRSVPRNMNGMKKFEIESIIEEDVMESKFLIKWRGYGIENNSC